METIRKVAFTLWAITSLSTGLFCAKPTDHGNETHTIDLTGKVMDKDGKPMANAVAHLVGHDLADTTDSDGIYRINETIAAAKAKADPKDSLEILKDGQIITIFELAALVDTLDDVFVLQRDISGKIDSTVTSFSRVEAVVSYANDTTAPPKVAQLWYNTATKGYSGFVYFAYTSDVQEYAIYVNVYNDDSLFAGRSTTIEFTSIAGDIEIPTFSPLNAVPVADAGTDTTVSINDAISLIGSATDSFDGTISKWEWDIGNTGNFVQTFRSDTVILAPAQENTNYECVLRVTDNDGNIDTDIVVISVFEDAPDISISGNTTVAINSSITFTAQPSQSFGSITKYRWDNGIEPGWDDSTGASYTCTLQVETTTVVKLEVVDDDGNTSTATKTLVITNDAPVITGLKDTTISINDVVTFTVDVTDSNGVVQKYYWDFGDGSATEFDTTTANTTSHQFPSVAKICTISVNLCDSFGKQSLKNAVVTVLRASPVVEAGNDTIVGINDTIRLHTVGSDSLGGQDIKFAWKLGQTNDWKVAPAGDTIAFAPATAQTYICSLRATDDDENLAYDAMTVTVETRPPVAQAGNDTIVGINDTIFFSGAGSTDETVIVQFAWKFGNNPTWIPVANGDTFCLAPSTMSIPSVETWVCSLSVMDDDNNIVYDTKIVTIGNVLSGIDAGERHGLFLKDNSTLWACGNNEYGQYGNGTRTIYYRPVQVMTGVQSISASYCQSLILKVDGSLWASGFNSNGELGNGATGSQQTPVQVMIGVQSSSAGEHHSLILKTDNSLWVCGKNDVGQLGDGTTTNRLAPAQVMTDVQSISAGYQHSLILKTDNTLWACGGNYYGELGDGTTTDRHTPVQVMTDVVAVSAGYHHTLILKTDSTLWVCGRNEVGQLGDGTTTDRYTPVQVMTGVKSMCGGLSHSLIVKTDGTLWTCGDNGVGQLGDGTTTDRHTPVQVMTDVQAAAAGEHHSYVVKTDGTLWAFGRNKWGQLGDNTTTDRHTPFQVMKLQ